MEDISRETAQLLNTVRLQHLLTWFDSGEEVMLDQSDLDLLSDTVVPVSHLWLLNLPRLSPGHKVSSATREIQYSAEWL